MITARIDSLVVTRGIATSLAPSVLTGNDTTSPGHSLTLLSVGNPSGATVSLVAGKLVVVATAATGGFDYTVRSTDGSIVTGRAEFTSLLSTTGTDLFIPPINATGADLQGQQGNDTLGGTNGADLLAGGAGDDTLRGEGGADVLRGGDGNDLLDGGTGADLMDGGLGNDTYTVDDYADQVIEASGAGVDLARVLLPYYTLSANVENGIAVGTGAFVLSGNALANVLTGASLGDYLSGAAGNDKLYGMAGADTLFGGDGDDLLDGGADNDYMRGYAGNDTYVVDHIYDIAYEEANAGVDTVRVTLASYTLLDNVEHLVAAGAGPLTGTGNVLANSLTGGNLADVLSGLAGNDLLLGNAGNDTLLGGMGDDTLNGGVGADRMEGDTGNDTYIVDDVGDTVIEVPGGGTDTVRTTLASYTLSSLLENLTAAGAGPLNGTGNASNNVLTGAAAADVLSGLGGSDSIVGNGGNDLLFGGDGVDTLNGGQGADRMEGGADNDTYIVDDVGDLVIELAGGGSDTVRTNLASYTLGDHVEVLTQSDAIDFTGTGNLLANTLNGGGGNDTLRGLEGSDALLGGLGNDTLIGGLGIDVLTGGGGADLFRFESIAELGRTPAGTDSVRDLVRDQLDRIDLSAIDADTGTAGDQAFSFVGSAAFSARAGELRAVTSGADSTVFGDVNGDGVADFAIQVIGIATMQATDFIA